MSMTEHHHHALLYLTADSMTAAGGVVHAFSTRQGGVSEGIYTSLNLGANRGDDPARVRQNYHILCSAIGISPSCLVFSKQVHGDQIRVVTASDAGKGLDRPVDYEADGLICDDPNAALVVFSADCIPILLYDPVRGAIGAVHAGWRGTALGIAAKAVNKMSAVFGCQPAHILAAIGPGLSQCCFETDEDVPAAMWAALGTDAAPYLAQQGAKWHVDLKGLNRQFLQNAGVQPDHISISADCTRCLPDRYWSHRVTGNQRGSQAALIQLIKKESV